MTTRSHTEPSRIHGPECATWPRPDDRGAPHDPSVDEWWFLATKPSVAHARAMVRLRLAELGISEDVAENAVLVLSELATNAALHSRSAELGSYLVRLRHTEAMVLIEVRDAGGGDEPCLPQGDASSHLTENGRGLILVDYFTTRWWTRSDDGGRTVCAEFSLTD
jgi:serine/threonine-protein kinase RsbW